MRLLPLALLALPAACLVLMPTQLQAQVPAGAAVSSAAEREDLAVTIYNDNLGLVKDIRKLGLKGGQVPLRFSDVAAQIDATSVSFRSLSHPDAVDVLEQNYEYDLITPGKLLDKFVGREVTIELPAEENKPAERVQATLLSTNEGQVFRIGDQIHLQPPGRVILPELPPDLVAKPSLVWTLDVKRPGSQRIEASYMTAGMSWQADYVLVSSQDNKKADMTGWVTLKNESGATYPAARLTLVAGDVHRAGQPEPMHDYRMREMAAAPKASSQFQEQALFEYHSYDLNRRTTLKNNQTKQLTLLSAANMGTRKVYVFDGVRGPRHGSQTDLRKVQVMLEFENTKRNALGMPLPKGRVRVYQEDAAKKLQFIGEDRIDHTPKDEKILVEMGNAFDIVGERRQTNQKNLTDDLREYSYEVKLRNHKDSAVTVDVLEHVWGEWTVTQKSHKFEKLSQQKILFPVKVPANGEAKVTYTVRVKY